MNLKACPNKPNCISTEDEASNGGISPFLFSGHVKPWKERVTAIVSRMQGASLVEEKENYMRFEFRSLIFKFVDDFEVYFDADARHIHFRSASRVGYYDFGVNRRRIKLVQREMKI